MSDKCLVRVIVRNIATGEVDHDRVVDHNVAEQRQWMGKTSFWAFRNGREMVTRPEEG